MKKNTKIKAKKPQPFLGKLLKKIAPQIGARVLIEPQWGVVCQVTFKNGKRCYFRYNTLDLNYMGASEIARDKDYCNFFMKRMKYPTIPGRAFYSKRWARAIGSDQTIDQAYIYATNLGFPVVVKPNSGSQGSHVSLVANREEFYAAMNSIFKAHTIALVQKYIEGRDYRIVVLDKKIISAYERIPLSVVGDGISTIKKLLQERQKQFLRSGRDTRINVHDIRIRNKLKSHSLSLLSVIEEGRNIFLLDNANLSTGGDSIDVTERIHPEFKNIACNLTRDMGLRLCGVDLMIQGSIVEKPKKYWVIEINSAPGLDHYAASGKVQEKIVEDLYLEVLKSLEEK